MSQSIKLPGPTLPAPHRPLCNNTACSQFYNIPLKVYITSVIKYMVMAVNRGAI